MENPTQIEFEYGAQVGMHMHLCCEGIIFKSVLYKCKHLPEGMSLQKQVRKCFKRCVTMTTVHKFHVSENENSSIWMAVSGINNLTYEALNSQKRRSKKKVQEKESKSHEKRKQLKK